LQPPADIDEECLHGRRAAGAVARTAALVLLCFTARRLLLALAAASRPAAKGHPGEPAAQPEVALLVPARNEAAGADALLGSLAALDFPVDRLTITLVDDCSDDATAVLFDEWAETRPHVSVVRLPEPIGKYRALNEAIGSSAPATIVAICDADVRPRPTWLSKLVEPFADPRVGAVAGYLSPENADEGIFARYAAVESWVHQLVTSAGKDRLGLDPPTLGACAYRRTALDDVGWFGASASGEDVRISNALTDTGWRIRFAEEAVADNTVVHTPQDYWHQHLRWARNVFASHPAPTRPRSHRPVPLGRRVESIVAAAGYADRVALLVVVVAVRARTLPRWLPRTYAAVAGLEVVVAIVRAGHARQLPRFVVATTVLFPVDVAASSAAAVAEILDRPRSWRQPQRRGSGQGARSSSG